MDWKAFIREHYPTAGDPPSRPRFQRPAMSKELSELEFALGGRLPDDIKEVLTQTDGILDELLIGGEWLENIWLMWPCSELKLLVKSHREAGVPHEYLAFSPAGADGILFLCSIGSDHGTESPVFVWSPIENTIEPIAESLAAFYLGWLRGDVNV
jgi:hypothetical protein